MLEEKNKNGESQGADNNPMKSVHTPSVPTKAENEINKKPKN